MYTSKKIIICKFNLKNKCKFGEKCKFQHIGIKELNDILAKFEDLKQENVLLKLNLKKKSIKLSSLENMHCDVTNESTYALVKPLYNSFFSKNKVLKNQKERFNQLNELKQTVKPEGSGIEEDSKSIDKSLAKSKPNLKLKMNTKK
jgi:hypothetical protein